MASTCLEDPSPLVSPSRVKIWVLVRADLGTGKELCWLRGIYSSFWVWNLWLSGHSRTLVREWGVQIGSFVTTLIHWTKATCRHMCMWGWVLLFGLKITISLRMMPRQELKAGTCRQEQRWRLWRNAADRSVLCGLLILLSYATQSHLPGSGHYLLPTSPPPTLIIRKTPQTCP